MDTKVMNREQISAFADGELGSEETTLALAALRSSEEREVWNVYHQIGDVLRSEDMGISLSSGFSAKMSALLDAEPTIIAPQNLQQIAPAVAEPQVAVGNVKSLPVRSGRRFVLPGAAVAAAVIAAVYVVLPQQAVMTADNVNTPAQVAVAAPNLSPSISTVAATSSQVDFSRPQGGEQFSALAQQGEVKRDPRIDEYLFAHQRFSPSMYSSAQYARSAAFSVGADNK